MGHMEEPGREGGLPEVEREGSAMNHTPEGV